MLEQPLATFFPDGVSPGRSVLGLLLVIGVKMCQHTFWRLRWGTNRSNLKLLAMVELADTSEVTQSNIVRLAFENLPAEA
jgi:hypothetical protein